MRISRMSAFAACVISGLANAQAPTDATSGATSVVSREVAELKAELEAVKSMLPTQSHVMADVDAQAANLWFAGKAGNWPLATFFFGETRGRLNWAVRVQPVRKLVGGSLVELKPILDAFDASLLTPLHAAIDRKDRAAFVVAYKNMIGGCAGCHASIEKPYLRTQVPTSPAAHLIRMEPAEK